MPLRKKRGESRSENLKGTKGGGAFPLKKERVEDYFVVRGKFRKGRVRRNFEPVNAERRTGEPRRPF